MEFQALPHHQQVIRLRGVSGGEVRQQLDQKVDVAADHIQIAPQLQSSPICILTTTIPNLILERK
jgi:hypothetical protein